MSLKFKARSPRHAGVAIYDKGVRRTTMTQEHTGSNAIEFGTTPARLYGHTNETSDFSLLRPAVDSQGVAKVASVSAWSRSPMPT